MGAGIRAGVRVSAGDVLTNYGLSLPQHPFGYTNKTVLTVVERHTMSPDATCPFCCLEPKHYLDQNDEGFVIRDLFPVNPGHTLIIAKRHVSSFFLLTRQEVDGLWQLMQRAKVQLDSEFAPLDYNIGINDGPNAGQTVPHVHVHLMARYPNDTADPRGGVRRIIAERAIYTKE